MLNGNITTTPWPYYTHGCWKYGQMQTFRKTLTSPDPMGFHLVCLSRQIICLSNNHKSWLFLRFQGEKNSVFLKVAIFLPGTLLHILRVHLLLQLSSMKSTCTTFYCQLTNSKSFIKNLLNWQCLFLFCTQLVSEIFLIVRIIQLDIIIKVHKSSFKVPIILVRFQSLLNSPSRFSKSSNFIFHENSLNGNWIVACGWTDRHDELIVSFCHFVNAPNNNKT
jgi:hypothetical protein